MGERIMSLNTHAPRGRSFFDFYGRGVGTLCLFSLFAIPLLHAQTASTGAISGVVRDSSQALIPGVQIKATNSETLESRETLTNESGSYSIRLLPPGMYSLTFSLPGLKTIIREGVTIRVTESSTVDVVLEIALQGETVTVVADAQILQTNSSTLGRVVDSRQLTE